MEKTNGHELIESLRLESVSKDDVGYDVIYVVMTPEAAQYILDNCNYEDNRSIRKSSVSMYAHDIGSGQWHTLACDSITISDTGKLLNGQHRLMAIVKAGKPVVIEIRVGVPESEYPYFDHASKRNAADAFKSGTRHKTCVASTCKALIRIRRAGEITRESVTTSGSRFAATDADCLKYYEALSKKYPGMLEMCANFAYKKDVLCFGWTPGAISASCAIMYMISPGAFEEFSTSVSNRELYTQSLDTFRNWTRISCKTWNKYRNTERNYMSYCAASLVWNEIHGEKPKSLRTTIKCKFIGFEQQLLDID